jgi:uncharacterized coiled-coil protein SlyX
MTTTEQSSGRHAKSDAADERIAQLEAQLAAAMNAIDTLSAQVVGTQAPPTGGQELVERSIQQVTKEEEPPRTTMTLQELRKYEGTLYVKHNDPMRQFSCHQRLGDGQTGVDRRVDFDLGPAGHPESVGILPKLALEIRGVQRAWKRGIITISKDEDMEHEIDLLMNQHAQMAEAQIEQLLAPLAASNTEKDIVTKPCLVCGRWARDETGAQTLGIEGGQVFQRYADYMAGTPPMCPAHEHMSHLYVGSLVTDPQTGVQEWKFQKSAVGQTVAGLPSVDQAQQERPLTIQRQGQAPRY